MQKLRIALTGGGSGGHIYPLLAVAKKLLEIAEANSIDIDLRYFGPRDQFAGELSPAGITFSPIMAGKFRRYFSLWNLVDIPKIIIGTLQAFIKLYFFMPDALFSKGGTGAFPVVFVAWFYRIPILIHDSDAAPGLTNILSARFAKRIAVSFEETIHHFNQKKTALTGNPVRAFFLENRMTKTEAKEQLGFDPVRLLLVVLGGSQGSERINEFLVANLESLLKEFQVLHQIGVRNYTQLFSVLPKFPGYRAVPYLDLPKMKLALTAADVVFGRPGSGTLFEIASFGVPAILIPHVFGGNGHQRDNAYAYARTGGAIVIEEENLSPQIVLHEALAMIKDPDRVAQIAQAVTQFARPDAAKMLAEEVLRLAIS